MADAAFSQDVNIIVKEVVAGGEAVDRHGLYSVEKRYKAGVVDER